jgi:hypothetical protein
MVDALVCGLKGIEEPDRRPSWKQGAGAGDSTNDSSGVIVVIVIVLVVIVIVVVVVVLTSTSLSFSLSLPGHGLKALVTVASCRWFAREVRPWSKRVITILS